MTRLRYVKGDVTETTGGNYKVYSKQNIEIHSHSDIIQTGKEKGVSFGEPEKPESKDFDLEFVLDKQEDTIVPFGIFDFKDNYENPYFSFKYTLSKADVDSLSFEIIGEDGNTIYQMGYLQTVVVEASKKPLILTGITEKEKDKKAESKTIDFASVYLKYALQEPDYTKTGIYAIHWDGFDNNEIYDSTLFNGKKLKAKITATKDGKSKKAEVNFSIKYSHKWLDIKIDKKLKKIDISLRIDLTDGGNTGIDNGNRVPSDKQKLYIPIDKRTKSYSDLEDLAIEGVKNYWSRNSQNIAKGLNIGKDFYEINVSASANKDNSLSAPKIIYLTNESPGRSRNWELSRILFYNVGWLKYTNGWSYETEARTIPEFQMTSAHEIGHELLLAYGGQTYSKSHKGSSTVITQEDLKVPLPSTGEIDLMMYYDSYYDMSRTVASEKDLLGLIWCSKLKII